MKKFLLELKGKMECQKSIGMDFYIFSSISVLWPGIASLHVYSEIKNMMLYIYDTEKITSRASGQYSAHQKPWRQHERWKMGQGFCRR